MMKNKFLINNEHVLMKWVDPNIPPLVRPGRFRPERFAVRQSFCAADGRVEVLFVEVGHFIILCVSILNRNSLGTSWIQSGGRAPILKQSIMEPTRIGAVRTKKTIGVRICP